MSESCPSSVQQRELYIRRFRADRGIDPTDGQRAEAIADAPDPMRDYEETDLSELLRLDFRGGHAIVEPSFFCNLRCRFCSLPVESRMAIDWSQIRKPIQMLSMVGLRRAVITGGEPAILGGICEMVSDLSAMGIHVTMLSHGLWAHHRHHLDSLLDAGMKAMLVSIKAFDEETFDKVTDRRRFFRHQQDSLVELSKAYAQGQLEHLQFNHVITRETLPGLACTEWLEALEVIPKIRLSLVEPYEAYMVDQVPAPNELEQGLERVFSAWDELGVDYSIEGAPLCVLGQRWRRSADTDRTGDDGQRVFVTPRSEGDYLLVYRGYQRLLQFTLPNECSDCDLRQRCPGVHKRMHGAWDMSERAANLHCNLVDPA